VMALALAVNVRNAHKITLPFRLVQFNLHLCETTNSNQPCAMSVVVSPCVLCSVSYEDEISEEEEL
jgi:hypothetical protein